MIKSKLSWAPKLSWAFGAAAAAGLAGLALAQPAAAPAIPAPVVDKGDITWMLISSAFVLLMTVPGLALFYGGLVRTKNMLSVLMQVFTITCVVMIVWCVYGYSMAFTSGQGALAPFVGGFSKLFLSGVVVPPAFGTPGDVATYTGVAATFSNGVYLPELVFVLFQMTFACITPALIVGAFAERIKFSGMVVFMILWVTIVYFPIAHMVWFWPGPDFVADAALKGQDVAQYIADNSGFMFNKGALDFAGGTVVHINAGIAGFVLCLLLGKRIGFGRDAMPPHSLVMTMIGACLLWVGWFGFNAGSNLESNFVTVVAMANTFVATAAAAMGWMVIEWLTKGHPSILGALSGAVAGLVAVTPAAGFAGPMGAIILGLVVGVVCFFFCTTVKNAFKYDDSLDVFGVHCIGGIVGAIGTGILDNPDFGGQGIADYATAPGTLVAGTYDMATQVWIQTQGVLVTLVWSSIGTVVLYFIVNAIIGMRVKEDAEREGLDISSHGERAYNY